LNVETRIKKKNSFRRFPREIRLTAREEKQGKHAYPDGFYTNTQVFLNKF